MLYTPSKKSYSKRMRKQNKQGPVSYPTPFRRQELPFPEASEVELYEDLFWSAFSDLPHTCQKILLLKWCDYSNTEISNRLGINEDIIEERIIRCTRTFVSKVKDHRDYRHLKDKVLRD